MLLGAGVEGASVSTLGAEVLGDSDGFCVGVTIGGDVAMVAVVGTSVTTGGSEGADGENVTGAFDGDRDTPGAKVRFMRGASVGCAVVSGTCVPGALV